MESPARAAIVSTQSRPMAFSRVELDIGRGLMPRTQEATTSFRPALQRRSRKARKPPGKSFIMERRPERTVVVLEGVSPNSFPASARTESSIPMVLLLDFGTGRNVAIGGRGDLPVSGRLADCKREVKRISR